MDADVRKSNLHEPSPGAAAFENARARTRARCVCGASGRVRPMSQRRDRRRAPTAASRRHQRRTRLTRVAAHWLVLSSRQRATHGAAASAGASGAGTLVALCFALSGEHRRQVDAGWHRARRHVAAAQRDTLHDIIPPMNTGGWSAIPGGARHAGRRRSSDTAAAGVPYSLTLVDFDCMHDQAASDPRALLRGGGLLARKAPRPAGGGTSLPRTR